MLSSGRPCVSVQGKTSDTITVWDLVPKQTNQHKFPVINFLIIPLSEIVKTSPSKKRRAVAHGPQKKAGASGPPLSTQTSSTSQNHLLERQISSEAKEEAEGDSGKS